MDGLVRSNEELNDLIFHNIKIQMNDTNEIK